MIRSVISVSKSYLLHNLLRHALPTPFLFSYDLYYFFFSLFLTFQGASASTPKNTPLTRYGVKTLICIQQLAVRG